MNIDTGTFEAIQADRAQYQQTAEFLARSLAEFARNATLVPRLEVIDGGRQKGGRHRRPKLHIV